MKSILIAVALIASSFQAFAGDQLNLECSNGFTDGDDRAVAVSIQSGMIQISRHETFYNVVTEVQVNDRSMSVLNQEIIVHSEGMKYVEVIDALMVYNAERKELNVTMLTDGYTALSEVLKCK